LDTYSALVLLTLLLVKHMFADFFLQTPSMLQNRADYVHQGRAVHCGVHVVGTAVCFVIMAVPLALLLLLLIAEFILHYHIDFSKGWVSDRAGHGPGDASFWRAFGADQTLHNLTYVGMVWMLV